MAVLALNDIFRLMPRTLQGAGRLVAFVGALVLRPYLFGGEPLPLSVYSQDADEKKYIISLFLEWKANTIASTKKLFEMVAEIKLIHIPVWELGVFMDFAGVQRYAIYFCQKAQAVFFTRASSVCWFVSEYVQIVALASGPDTVPSRRRLHIHHCWLERAQKHLLSHSFAYCQGRRNASIGGRIHQGPSVQGQCGREVWHYASWVDGRSVELG